MPVILRRGDERLWLDENLDEQRIKALLSPYDMKDMEAYPVTKEINKLGYNTRNSEVLKEYLYPELPGLDFN